MATLKGSWHQVAADDSIRRSSQIISSTGQDVILFGGEIQPRQPVDNKLYRIPLNGLNSKQSEINVTDVSSAPSPRVGSGSTTLNGFTYLFSGRGGQAMAPIEENGALHVLDLQTAQWSLLKPSSGTGPCPEARSYHTMTSDNKSTIYLHAGCPEKGRLADLWAFDINQSTWRKLSDAPGPQRGGTSIAYYDAKLYRMNGFDGKNEQGFALDFYDISTDKWSTITWDVDNGPSPRSVSALLAVKINGKDSLLTMFGEADPSSLGHQGAGKMLDDVWAYDLAAGKWLKVNTEGDKPQPRGWFAADWLREKKQVVVQGGLAEDNTRIGDMWTLAF